MFPRNLRIEGDRKMDQRVKWNFEEIKERKPWAFKPSVEEEPKWKLSGL